MILQDDFKTNYFQAYRLNRNATVTMSVILIPELILQAQINIPILKRG